jgi:hypothetical protein
MAKTELSQLLKPVIRLLMKYLFFFFFITTGLINCNDKESLPEKVTKKFNANKTELNNLVNELLINHEVDSLFNGQDKYKWRTNEFPPAVSKQLVSLGILDVSQHYWPCLNKEQKLFIFKTNWIPKDSIFIVYNICDTIETKKGFYRKDKNDNEVWGLGNSWQMLKIVKYMSAKQ